MLSITPFLSLSDEEVQIRAVRSQGPGGQNVNKVSTAVHVRFDVRASSLPADLKDRLLAARDRRITRNGVVVIKAQNHRSQEMNRNEALNRLADLIRLAMTARPERKRTKLSPAAHQRRIERKRLKGAVKRLRQKASIEIGETP